MCELENRHAHLLRKTQRAVAIELPSQKQQQPSVGGCHRKRMRDVQQLKQKHDVYHAEVAKDYVDEKTLAESHAFKASRQRPRRSGNKDQGIQHRHRASFERRKNGHGNG